MRRALFLAVVLVAAAACASVRPVEGRSELIRQILRSTVQLRSEREGGARRAASGVVLATHPETERVWILTARHFVDPPQRQRVHVRLPGRDATVPGAIAFLSPELDVAIIETERLDVAPVRLRTTAHLGDEVLVVAFPWGRRFTVVGGIVSQVVAPRGDPQVMGPVRMIDASVSYGSSGGGVFDARTGELLGIVEGYRTAKVAIPEMKERALEVPVAGETTLVPAAAILRFLEDSGLGGFLPR